MPTTISQRLCLSKECLQQRLLSTEFFETKPKIEMKAKTRRAKLETKEIRGVARDPEIKTLSNAVTWAQQIKSTSETNTQFGHNTTAIKNMAILDTLF